MGPGGTTSPVPAIRACWAVGGARLPVTSPDRDLFVADFPLGTHHVIVTTTWAQGSADYLFRVEIRLVPVVREPLDRTG